MNANANQGSDMQGKIEYSYRGVDYVIDYDVDREDRTKKMFHDAYMNGKRVADLETVGGAGAYSSCSYEDFCTWVDNFLTNAEGC